MDELELKDFREGFGFGDESIKLKKHILGGYREKDVDSAIKQLNNNCIAMQKAFDEKNKSFTQGIAKANQEIQDLSNQIEQLQSVIAEKEREAVEYKAEIDRLNNYIAEMEEKLEEVKHIRNDETIIKENLCLQDKIEADLKEIENMRALLISKDEIIMQNMQEIDFVKNKAQSDLNIAYRTLGFRMEKIKNIIADFQDVTAEIDRIILNKLEEIARTND